MQIPQWLRAVISNSQYRVQLLGAQKCSPACSLHVPVCWLIVLLAHTYEELYSLHPVRSCIQDCAERDHTLDLFDSGATVRRDILVDTTKLHEQFVQVRCLFLELLNYSINREILKAIRGPQTIRLSCCSWSACCTRVKEDVFKLLYPCLKLYPFHQLFITNLLSLKQPSNRGRNIVLATTGCFASLNCVTGTALQR